MLHCRSPLPRHHHRRSHALVHTPGSYPRHSSSSSLTMPRPPLLTLRAATFRQTPKSAPLFPNTTLTLPSASQKWSVLGASKSPFLSVLRGSHVADPPNSRLYPLLAERNKWPQTALQLVSFGGGSSGGGGTGMLRGGTGGDGYLSARYETLREEFDLTLREWLCAAIDRHVNPYETSTTEAEAQEEHENEALLGTVARELLLEDLLDQAVMTLSNGQSRRARIAQALLKRPEALLVDEPFMGLDPPGKRLLSRLLREKAETTPVVLGLRLQDPVPEWITHVAFVENGRVVASGGKTDVVQAAGEQGRRILLEGQREAELEQGVVEKVWAGVGLREESPQKEKEKEEELPEAIVEMKDVRIAYYDKVILDSFNWTIRRGDKWCLFGPNGSGKTTLTSLLTSDHPLTYSLPIRHFGRPRLPTPGQPGISVFELQSRIGVASPELHSFFPRHLSLRRCVLSGFADTFLSPPSLTAPQRALIEAALVEFRDLLSLSSSSSSSSKDGDGDRDVWDVPFSDADLSSQRLALFLRAALPRRELLVLDEAFSGMTKGVRERCFGLLETAGGWEPERQAMVVVSHVSEEVPPGMKKWVRLSEKGGKEPAVFGEF